MPPILITSKEESFFVLFFYGTSCATVSCIRSLNMRRHGEAAGLCIWTPVQRLGPRICISSYDSWRSLFNTLFCGSFLEHLYDINHFYTLLSRITKHPLIEGVGPGRGLVSGEQPLCFQLNGVPGYMPFTCITVIYCDISTTPTDNTALLWIRGITEGNSGTGGGVGLELATLSEGWFLIQ